MVAPVVMFFVHSSSRPELHPSAVKREARLAAASDRTTGLFDAAIDPHACDSRRCAGQCAQR